MDRAQHLALADEAVMRAAKLADDAERYASNTREKTPAYAAASEAWSTVARTHAAIAALLPDTTTED
ncbi:hypothetical protein GCM10010330_16260 [Streptomyces tendae]|uniref:hypothetical protein n=1 Tax=Streptomyces tendae TaxID=1932 RepID=UPI00167828B2|nr:hypothetical protein [Streptomyces tendae]GHA64194.1 hypothetical protein GCM10010330_16260 [Streptomyces tendae]